MKKTVALLFLDSEEEYRQEYSDCYVSVSTNFLKDIPVFFSLEDFEHIFFEPAPGEDHTRVFSPRRAKRMYFIKEMLGEEMSTEIMFEPETGNVAVFCPELEAVMYLRPRTKTQSLQLATFFDFGRDHTKMLEKQKRKCIPITEEQLKEAVVSGLTTS